MSGRGAAFHLAVLGEDVAEVDVVGVVGGRFVELVVPLIAGALVVVPPVAVFFFVAAVQLAFFQWSSRARTRLARRSVEGRRSRR